MDEKLAIDGGAPVRAPGRMLVFGAPRIERDEMDEVLDSMRKGWIGTGPKVHRFESDFAAYKGARHAVALNSCTAALHLSMLALGIGPGDEVITTPMTFCATINAIIHCGATPVLADIDPVTFNIDPAAIAQAITPRTKAILPVHFAGRCCDMAAIMALAREHGLKVVEDCAHAIETEQDGIKAGRFGDMGCFSFYVTKNVVTGEGGIVVTEDDQLAAHIKVLGLHGMSKDAWKRFSDEGYRHYQVVHAGYKYNMMDIQAAMGIHQLGRVEAWWSIREQIWRRFNEAFAGLPCRLPADPVPNSRHAFHLYTPLVDIDRLGRERDWVLDAMTAENIGVGVHYVPVHLHPYYRNRFGWSEGDFPQAERVGARTVSLPLSPALSEQDVEDVITAFSRVLRVGVRSSR